MQIPFGRYPMDSERRMIQEFRRDSPGRIYRGRMSEKVLLEPVERIDVGCTLDNLFEVLREGECKLKTIEVLDISLNRRARNECSKVILSDRNGL